MTKRIFIGIKPDEKTLKNIKIFQEEFSHLPIHWADLDNIHLTLLPPWKPKDFASDLRKFQAFRNSDTVGELTFTQIQLYKPKSILWATGNAPENLIKLVNELASYFNAPPQDRKFLMHITLAKHVDQEIQLPQIEVLWEFVPSSLILYESIQSKTGTVYNKISEISLA